MAVFTIERHQSNDFASGALVFPTLMNLQKRARNTQSAAALDAARASRVVIVVPKQERNAEGVRLPRLPLEAGYGGELFESSAPPSMPDKQR